MKAIIKQKPLYLFLLSVFFVFHGYTENFDFIPVKDSLLLLLIYLFSSVILATLAWLIYRRISKAALAAFLFMALFFFFGYAYDILYQAAPGRFISKFSVILAASFFLILVALIWLYRRKSTLTTLNYVLNVFFICLLLVDTVWLAGKIISRKDFSDDGFVKNIKICDSCSKPDIYLIIADEYAGDEELKDIMNFDNSQFREQLKARGFYSPVSRSNYNFTPFSVGSMLQMDYLENLEGSNTSHSDLSKCYELIRENRTFQFLYYHGYQLENLSIFDIHDQPSLVKESVLPEKTRFITAQTLFNRIDNNILFNMANRLGPREKKRRLMMAYNSNVKALGSLKNVVSSKTSKPKFVYTHLIMPHFPYYFNKEGLPRELSEMETINEKNLDHYVEYLQYTNRVLIELIDHILSKSQKPPVILLVSDHGFREFSKVVHQKYYFSNLLSVYIPDRNYEGFYDNMSNVNLFRILFNKQFHQQLPLLKDSSSFLLP